MASLQPTQQTQGQESEHQTDPTTESNTDTESLDTDIGHDQANFSKFEASNATTDDNVFKNDPVSEYETPAVIGDNGEPATDGELPHPTRSRLTPFAP